LFLASTLAAPGTFPNTRQPARQASYSVDYASEALAPAALTYHQGHGPNGYPLPHEDENPYYGGNPSFEEAVDDLLPDRKKDEQVYRLNINLDPQKSRPEYVRILSIEKQTDESVEIFVVVKPAAGYKDLVVQLWTHVHSLRKWGGAWEEAITIAIPMKKVESQTSADGEMTYRVRWKPSDEGLFEYKARACAKGMEAYKVAYRYDEGPRRDDPNNHVSFPPDVPTNYSPYLPPRQKAIQEASNGEQKHWWDRMNVDAQLPDAIRLGVLYALSPSLETDFHDVLEPVIRRVEKPVTRAALERMWKDHMPKRAA
jgi:hypothetical protein